MSFFFAIVYQFDSFLHIIFTFSCDVSFCKANDMPVVASELVQKVLFVAVTMQCMDIPRSDIAWICSF